MKNNTAIHRQKTKIYTHMYMYIHTNTLIHKISKCIVFIYLANEKGPIVLLNSAE